MDKKKLPLNILIGVAFLVLLIFAVSVLTSWQSTRVNRFPKASHADPILGSQSAKVKIIEFGDFQCPYCQELSVIFKNLKDKYKDDLAIIWKDFPISSIHTEALSAAQAGRCAQKQNKFWEMHDQLFTNQGKLAATLYLGLAQAIGLDTTKFIKCLNEGDTLGTIEKNIKEGTSLGVDGTPYFYLNHYVITELMSQEDLEVLINQELAK